MYNIVVPDPSVLTLKLCQEIKIGRTIYYADGFCVEKINELLGKFRRRTPEERSDLWKSLLRPSAKNFRMWKRELGSGAENSYDWKKAYQILEAVGVIAMEGAAVPQQLVLL